jgi:hypothetical protein
MRHPSSGKLAILHVARKQLGLDDDAWRGLLRGVAGVESSRDLSPAGFELVMARLAGLGFVSTSPLKPLPARRGMASPAQAQLMRHLWGVYTDGQGTEASLGKWLHGHFKVSALRFVDTGLAPKVIAGLRHMLERKAQMAAKAAARPPAA